MAGSPVFSINFTNRLIPAKPKYLMSIENSQAILKYFIDLAPVVQTLDSAIRRINHYPLDNSIGFASVYPLDSDLSGG